MQPNDETIVAGMVDGLISVRRREEDVTNEKPQHKKVSYRHSGKNLHTPQVDVVVHEELKETMSKHDAHLRKFQYSKALDCVMMSYVVNKTPHVTVALMQELVRRQGLKQALSGRNGKPLVTILKFLNKHVGSVRFGRVLLHVANVLMGMYIDFFLLHIHIKSGRHLFFEKCVLIKQYRSLIDIYEDHLDELTAETRKMFGMLAAKLEEEESLILALSELQGKLHMILSAAETVSPAPIKDTQLLEPSSGAQKNLILSIA